MDHQLGSNSDENQMDKILLASCGMPQSKAFTELSFTRFDHKELKKAGAIHDFPKVADLAENAISLIS